MNSLLKFFALAPAGRAVVVRSLLLLPVVAGLLHLRGLARTQAVLERLGRRGADDAGALAPREIARLIGATARLLRVRCLPRSLLLWHFVRHRETSAEIRLGVSKLSDGGLHAHAWVEIDGLPLNDGADVAERYAAFPVRAKQTSY